jgi:hypothetical protein
LIVERNRIFRIGGFVSGGVLIAFGIAVIVLSVIGGNTVKTNLKNECRIALSRSQRL